MGRVPPVRRRTKLRGAVCWKPTDGETTYAANCMEETGNWGGQTRPQQSRFLETHWKRTELVGKYKGSRDRAGVEPSGQTGEGGVFSNPEEQFGAKSQFNKEKWLPLVYTPFMISHYCCQKMKKQPMHKYQHDKGYKPILATLAEESRVRKQGWIRHGCNAFESKNPMSQPMSFWTEQDVLAYLVRYADDIRDMRVAAWMQNASIDSLDELLADGRSARQYIEQTFDSPIASVYGEIVHVGDDGVNYPPVDLTGQVMCNLKCTGCQRTGCAFCAFGMHLEKKGKTRFHILAEVEPRKYEFALEGGQWVDNPAYDPTAPKYDGEWLNWNPKKIWVPSKKGLGMRYVFDEVNQIYGKDFYRYE